MKPIAVQLYSLRQEAESDFPGVIRRIADVGYKGVEPAGLYGHDAKEIRKLVNDLGMEVCSIHAGVPNKDNVESIAETAQILGAKTVIGGFWTDDFKDLAACKLSAARFSEAGELLKNYDLSFAFHNHWMEFDKIEGRYVYDILMEEATGVCAELDVYWAAFSKADPVQVVAKYKSRLPLLHIKDGMLDESKMMTAIGSGLLPIPEIIKAADPDVLDWLVVELDACKTDMFEAVKGSYDYLTSNGLAAGNK